MKYLLLLIIILPVVAGIPSETIQCNNETINITPQYTTKCNYSTDDGWRIERTNYQTGQEAITLTYNITIIPNNTTQTIKKTFKKYTQTSTGNVLFETEANYTIYIQACDQKLTWNHQIRCHTNQTTNNITTNAHNQSLNNSINNTTTNQTTPLPKCHSQLNITTDKDEYQKGDRATISFSTYGELNSISYWIRDENKNFAKTNITTTNTDEKHHTFQKGGTHTIYAIGSFLCNTTRTKKEIYVEDDDNTVEIKESNIEMEVDEKNRDIIISTKIDKQNTRKSVIYIWGENEKGIITLPKQKIKIPSMNQQVETTHTYHLAEEKSVNTIHAEGIDVVKLIDFEIPSIEKNTTTQKIEEHPVKIINSYVRSKESNNITWYVRVKGKGEANITFCVSEGCSKQQHTLNGEKTMEFHIQKANPEETIIIIAQTENQVDINYTTHKFYEEKEKTITTITSNAIHQTKPLEPIQEPKDTRTAYIVAGSLLLLSMGALAGYGPKRAFDNIKKAL